jgi:hypothetical protein
MTRLWLAASSLTGGFSAALVPLLAVFVLDVRDYGAFSLAYLVLAQAWSVQLSAVCDTWARDRAAHAGGDEGWSDFASAITTISGVSAVVAFLVGWPVFGEPLPAAAMGVAVGATLYRQGGRYHHAVALGPRAVLPSDVVMVATFGAAFSGLTLLDESLLTSLLVAWAIAAVASAAFFLQGASGGRGLRPWYRSHRRTARTLLSESLLMDAGFTGTPVAVAPILGLADFGIYRSVYSLSVPLQLVIDPVRPNLSQLPLDRVTSKRALVTLLSVAAALAALGYGALQFLVPATFSFSPVLMALTDFAAACGLFVGFQFLNYLVIVFARMHLPHGRLVVGRACHSVFAIALPILGAVVAGLPGAMWCFVATIATSAATWIVLLLLASRRHSREPAAQSDSHVRTAP